MQGENGIQIRMDPDPKHWWRHFGKCPNKSRDPLGAFLVMSPDVSTKNPHPANRKQEEPLGLLSALSLQLSDILGINLL